MHVHPNHFSYSCPQEFPLEHSTKIKLEFLEDQLKEPSTKFEAFTRDQPINLLTTNIIFAHA